MHSGRTLNPKPLPPKPLNPKPLNPEPGHRESLTGCDKPCGGGQQIRDRVCLGSDGLKYPSHLGGAVAWSFGVVAS